MTEERLLNLENDVSTLKVHVSQIRDGAIEIAKRTTINMETAMANQQAAITYQHNSLSIPLLRDVLMPVIMRLFTFFAGLVILLLGAIMGIKWVAKDLLVLM